MGLFKSKEDKLYDAVLAGDTRAVKGWLREGANPNGRAYRGTPWTKAVLTGKLEVLQAFIDGGVDIDLRDHRKNTALMTVVEKNHLETLKFLIEAGADLNKQLHWKNTALLLAVKCNHIDAAQMLIEAGADIELSNDEERTPLIEASVQGRKEMVSLLLDSGADVSKRDRWDNSALGFACSAGDSEMAGCLIEAGAEISSENDSLLFGAISNRNVSVLRLLLDHGAELDVLDDYQRSLLAYAVERRDVESVRVLLEYGVDINRRDKGGKTALLQALYNRDEEIAYVLTNAGADVCLKDNNGSTAHAMAEYRGLSSDLVETIELAEKQQRSGWNYDGGDTVTYVSYDRVTKSGLRYSFNFAAEMVIIMPLDNELEATSAGFKEASFYDFEEGAQCYNPKFLEEAKRLYKPSR